MEEPAFHLLTDDGIGVPSPYVGSDKLLVAGGCTDITGKCVSNVVECFDIPSSIWTELPPMNHARSECAASCCRGESLVRFWMRQSSRVMRFTSSELMN